MAHSKKIQKFLARGAKISQHHCAVFAKNLVDSNLPAPVYSNFTPTTSTEPVFSDKLLLFHTNALINLGVSYYGQSIGSSQRRDIAASYARLMLEAGEYSQDGANLMIEHGWLEIPPSAPDRGKLMKD